MREKRKFLGFIITYINQIIIMTIIIIIYMASFETLSLSEF